jgi:hypothetical protein
MGPIVDRSRKISGQPTGPSSGATADAAGDRTVEAGGTPAGVESTYHSLGRRKRSSADTDWRTLLACDIAVEVLRPEARIGSGGRL